ncbi:hypothetical protein [Methylopila sp. M107]|uniref:hypothetical protein n=1 Tax=Methylopila sp. M107 TaxID=1101190 RepID=UPI00037BEB91|nr:hypothetical protein [Methylopila sp. M107]
MKKTIIYSLAAVFAVAGIAENTTRAQAAEAQPTVRTLEQLRANARADAMNAMAGGDLQTVGRHGRRGGRGFGRHRGWGGHRGFRGHRGWGGHRGWRGRGYYGGRRYYGGRGYYGRRYYGGPYYGYGRRRWCGYNSWGEYRCRGHRGPRFGIHFVL